MKVSSAYCFQSLGGEWYVANLSWRRSNFIVDFLPIVLEPASNTASICFSFTISLASELSSHSTKLAPFFFPSPAPSAKAVSSQAAVNVSRTSLEHRTEWHAAICRETFSLLPAEYPSLQSLTSISSQGAYLGSFARLVKQVTILTK